MKTVKISFVTFFILLTAFCGPVVPAEVVYDNTGTAVTNIWTSEVGDTVTLGGTKRFINSFTVGIIVGTNDIGETDDFRLRFYLPNAPDDRPGRLIWQSPPLTDVPLTETYQFVTFDIPEVRVPDTFIWCVEHGSGAGFLFANPPTVGSSPYYAWTNLTMFDHFNSNDFMAKIEATDRSDAILLGTANSSSHSGIGTEERHNMRFRMFSASAGDIKGPAFAGITEWDVGTFPSIDAQDYPQFAEMLTNGQNDDIYIFAEVGGQSGTEQELISKLPDVAPGYPDFYDYDITNFTLAIDHIFIDHSTSGWTYYTWDVTWEIWGQPSSAAQMDLDNSWMYQNLPGQVNSDLTAEVLITDDPMGNKSYSYEWEIVQPDDVSVKPATADGGHTDDTFWTLTAPCCDEPNSLSDSGKTFGVKVTVTGNDHGNTGIAEAEFGIALLGDANNDGVVNLADRSIINAFWRLGAAGSFTFRDCDVNCDGTVNVADRAIANAVWRGVLGENHVSNPCPLR